MEKVKSESTITCPQCGHKQLEKMPEGSCCNESCTCKNCGCVMKSRSDGCCIYCSCGDVCCPEAQRLKGDKCPCCAR